MKRIKLFGRAINEVAYNMEDDDAILVEYIIEYLERRNIKYEIQRNAVFENHVYVRVDCDDNTMNYLRAIEEDFYDNCWLSLHNEEGVSA